MYKHQIDTSKCDNVTTLLIYFFGQIYAPYCDL